jgi:hypothetical protein
MLRYIFQRSDCGVQQALTLKLHPTTRTLTIDHGRTNSQDRTG